MIVVPRVECTRPDADPFFAALACGAALVALLALSSYGLVFRRTVRWVTLPLTFLVPFAVRAVLPYFGEAAIAGMHVCSASSGWAAADGVAGWHRAWAPLQLVALALLTLQALRTWRSPARDDTAPIGRRYARGEGDET